MAIVKLKLKPSGQELDVNLTVINPPFDRDCNLPQLPQELSSFYCQWQSNYRDDPEVRSCISPEPGLRLKPISEKHFSALESAEHAEAVKTHLNQWLNSGDSEWLHIREELAVICSQLNSESEEINVLVDATKIDLCRLPWQEWKFFETHCPQAEIAFRLPKSKDHNGIIHPPSSSKVRILVVVGRSNGINTDRDLQEIKHLEKLGAEVNCLEQPSHEVLCDALRDQQGYHIFIFTGHSGSREDGQIGWIELNDEESLSIEAFKNALEKAINRGLQLAIFNSCDGLGLANQLAQLHLPQSIVMREPVPDKVAVKFLKYFFEEFTNGKSLFTSVHEARKRLEHFKSRYPGVDWLPVICMSHKGKKLPTWQNLCKVHTPEAQSSSETQEINTPPSKSIEESSESKLHVNHNYKNKFIAGSLVLVLGGCGVAIWWGSQKGQDTITPQNIVQQSQTSFRDINVPTGEWLYAGSTSWASINKVVHQQIQQEFLQVNFKYIPTNRPGSQTGITMLIEDQIAFAQSSRPLKDEELLRANKRGLKLNEVPVANDVIAIVVNPSLKIPGLTIDQLHDIYTGKITNWSQVGGPKLTITAYSRPQNASGTTAFFKETVLDSKDFGQNVNFNFTTSTDIQQIIGKSDPGGIYYLTASEISKSVVKVLPISRKNGGSFIAPQADKYPLVRRLFVIIKKDASKDEQIGKAYVDLLSTDEGQRLIKQALTQNVP